MPQNATKEVRPPATTLPAPPVAGATVCVGFAWPVAVVAEHCGCPSTYSLHSEADEDTGPTDTVDDGATYEELDTLVVVVQGEDTGPTGTVDEGIADAELIGHCGCPSTYSVHTGAGLDDGTPDGHCGCPSTYSVHTGPTGTVEDGIADAELDAGQ
jgi:hypothetical protein